MFGNIPKFGLGVESIVFDLLFMFQHYILYRDRHDPALDKQRQPDKAKLLIVGGDAHAAAVIPTSADASINDDKESLLYPRNENNKSYV